jgi:hypothetical protein
MLELNFCRNTLVVVNYKTEFSVKGQLIDKLDNGQLKGEFDLTLPTGHHFTGKVSSAGISCLMLRYVFKVAGRTNRQLDISPLCEAFPNYTCLGIVFGEGVDAIETIHDECLSKHPLTHELINHLCKAFCCLLLG